MTRESKGRVTLTLSRSALLALNRTGNASAYVEELVMRDALAASLDSHRNWFAHRGGQAALEADEREREQAT